MRRFSSMRARMTFACLLLLAPYLLFSSKLLVATTQRVETKNEERILQKVAFAAAGTVQEMDEASWRKSLTDMLQSPELDKRGVAICVMSGEQVLWQSSPKLLPWPAIKENKGWQVAVAKAPTAYFIVVGCPVEDDSRAQNYARWGLWGLSLLVLLAVGLGAWLLVGRTLLPIRLLAHQANNASVENLRLRLNAPSQDAEIVELVETLNGLLGRLSETAAAKGRFYSAASHELRTPLQALSGHLEVALSRPRTAQEYEQSLQEAHRQTGRLTSLVRDLLLLHQLDTAAEPGEKEMISLAEVCQRVLSQMEPLIEARKLRVQTELAEGVQICAVPTYIEILVRNLLENAVKYAREGGRVNVHLRVESGMLRFEVLNECAPLLETNPQRLFEPFYRPDTARSRKTGGNGLGLAICRALANANGWTVTLQATLEGVRALADFGADWRQNEAAKRIVP